MKRKTGTDVVSRWECNPVIAIGDLSFPCSDILNAGVVVIDEEVLLVLTVEGLQGRCALYLARSSDGRHFSVDDRPFMTRQDSGPMRIYESFGIRDPRITYLDGVYYITYVGYGVHGLRVGLAKTEDFMTVERMGMVSQVDVKNGVLFPRRINGRYALLERPNDGGSIWVRYSDDLEYWGDGNVVMTPRGGFWDTHLIGAAGPPMEIDEGWLLIYYGERQTSGGPLVRLGAAILDRENPSVVLGRSDVPILSPRERYERIGDTPNVVFSCGQVLRQDGTLELYYGASDSCIALATSPLEDVVRTCFETKEYGE